MVDVFRNGSTSGWLKLVGIGLLAGLLWPTSIYADDGVFCRFKVIQPAPGQLLHRRWRVHPRALLASALSHPAGGGEQGPQQTLRGRGVHPLARPQSPGRQAASQPSRSLRGIAELPNISAQFYFDKNEPATRKIVVIELATAADEKAVVKRFEETLQDDLTTFLVSPDLAKDKDTLESMSQMENRQLDWAMAASGGQRVSPKSHIIETTYYGPTTRGGTVMGSRVLSLLGFNYVGNQSAEVHAKFPELGMPGFTHNFDIATGTSRETIDESVKKQAPGYKDVTQPGAPFNFADEVCCYPNIGTNQKGLANFHAWLAERKILPQDLGLATLDQVVPIEDPKIFAEREAQNGPAARRVYYYTARFRQEASTQRLKWHTESFHKYFPKGLVTSTLVADHPYFGGTGLGMGLRTGNTTWGWNALALDWFDVARQKAVDMAGIEDWMGLQYMFGPKFTWEGFQLMGFQAAIFRSGSGGNMPICSWITPSDETNLRLKSAPRRHGPKVASISSTGPTALPPTAAKITGRTCAANMMASPSSSANWPPPNTSPVPEALRKTKVALLYSISSDLWRALRLHPHAGATRRFISRWSTISTLDLICSPSRTSKLGGSKTTEVLLATDPCITAKATVAIDKWVRSGGYLLGTCAAGIRNEVQRGSRRVV